MAKVSPLWASTIGKTTVVVAAGCCSEAQNWEKFYTTKEEGRRKKRRARQGNIIVYIQYIRHRTLVSITTAVRVKVTVIGSRARWLINKYTRTYILDWSSCCWGYSRSYNLAKSRKLSFLLINVKSVVFVRTHSRYIEGTKYLRMILRPPFPPPSVSSREYSPTTGWRTETVSWLLPDAPTLFSSSTSTLQEFDGLVCVFL